MGVLSNKIERDQLKPADHIYSWKYAYAYAHHGIYVGEGQVIHFTRGGGREIGIGTALDHVIFSSCPSSSRDLHARRFQSGSADNPCPKCGDQSMLDGVISSCLDCFLSGGELYLFEYAVSPAFFLAQIRGGTCTLAASDPTGDVLHRASYLLENGFGGYDLFKNNCEDFAIYCKTELRINEGRSGQAVSFQAVTSVIATTPLQFMTTSFPALTAVSCGVYCVRRLFSDIGFRRDVVKVPVERLVGGRVLASSEGQTSTETPKTG